MNRIIIIGNGFDLAHELKTSYKDFIDHYWAFFFAKVFSPYYRSLTETYREMNDLTFYQDDFASLEDKGLVLYIDEEFFYDHGSGPFCDLCRIITKNNIAKPEKKVRLNFKNHFFGTISTNCSLQNWVDIENEYYNQLKKLCLISSQQQRSEKVKVLNEEFNAVKKLLEHYLQEAAQSEVNGYSSIQEAVDSLIELKDIAIRKKGPFLNTIFKEIRRYEGAPESIEIMIRNNQASCKPRQTLFLNFNYTNTAEKLYRGRFRDIEIINIHGELNNLQNPIIFGYGDELDDHYKEIERLQENDFLEHIKSIEYHKTSNYRRLLEFVDSGDYQVFVMGHSCGNSDRTLLNTLFEHDNCASIKVYYWQKEDGSNNHNDLIRNISRNFNDKQKMRDLVVNRENCSPLTPMKKIL